MPRAYTPAEFDERRAALMVCARTRFAERGLKVTVSALAAEAGIGKGSFYLFFESKEALFFAVQEQVELEVKRELTAALVGLKGAALLERYFVLQFEVLRQHAFLRQLTNPAVIERLRAKVAPAVLADHQAADRAFYTGLVRSWIEAELLPAHLDPGAVFDVSAAAFALSLQSEIVGDGFDRVAALISKAVAVQLNAGDVPAE